MWVFYKYVQKKSVSHKKLLEICVLVKLIAKTWDRGKGTFSVQFHSAKTWDRGKGTFSVQFHSWTLLN